MSVPSEEEGIFGAPRSGGRDLASVTRALRVLQVVGAHNDGGIRFSSLGKAADLNNSTLHRLLQTLIHEGFVEQSPTTRCYNLGFRFLSLGAQAANRFSIRDLAHGALRRLAKNTEDTAFLSMPSYYDSVVIDRVEGVYPVKALAATVGSRRPLGVGAAALALLAYMPKDKRDQIIARNADRADVYPEIEPDMLHAAVEETRSQGFAVARGSILKGMTTVALTIAGPKREPLAAISIAAISERMSPRRLTVIVDEIRREATRIANTTCG